MLHFDDLRVTVRSPVAALALTCAACLAASKDANAADHTISPQTKTFECGSVRPGDTLTIPAGNRGPLRIRNCNGTKSDPIIVRNDPNGSGPAVIRGAAGTNGGFMLNCEGCTGVTIDGGAKWRGAPSGKTYGIKVTMAGRSSPTAFVRIGGVSNFVTIRNVEIDGTWPKYASKGSGIVVNDHAINLKNYPGRWREGILIEDNFIHDVALEGMYVGANYYQGDLPLRNVEIRRNRLEDTGWEAINTKSMWAGDNRVHHNVILRAGKNYSNKSKKSQYSGIMNMSGTVKIYNNWIESTGMHGIQVWTQEGPRESEGKGPFDAHIWNNVIVDAGGLWQSFMLNSSGISVGAQDGREKPVPFIYNNTIVNSRGRAIDVTRNVGKGVVRDNIAAGTRVNPVISVPGIVNFLNNRVGSIAQMEFVDPTRKNFRLKIGSPARNEGTNDYPPTDHADVPRPKEGAADQGAYEGSGS